MIRLVLARRGSEDDGRRYRPSAVVGLYKTVNIVTKSAAHAWRDFGSVMPGGSNIEGPSFTKLLTRCVTHSGYFLPGSHFMAHALVCLQQP